MVIAAVMFGIACFLFAEFSHFIKNKSNQFFSRKWLIPVVGSALIIGIFGGPDTPLACTLMGIELFGSENVIYYAVACFTAYYFSGHFGIYHSQRVTVSKFHTELRKEETIKQIKEKIKDMSSKINTKKIGKLLIYLKYGETVSGEKFMRKLFPVNKYRKIMDEAKKSGIMNAHIYHTHAA